MNKLMSLLMLTAMAVSAAGFTEGSSVAATRRGPAHSRSATQTRGSNKAPEQRSEKARPKHHRENKKSSKIARAEKQATKGIRRGRGKGRKLG